MSVNHSLFMRFPNGLAKAVTLSYDDGVKEDARLVEILDRHGLKCTFNICSGQYAKDGVPSRTDRTWGLRLTREEATNLYKNSGHEVALHGYTHPFLERIPVAQATYEVMKNRETLEEQFDTFVRGMAYPYGTHSDELAEVLKNCGVAYSRTTKSTLNFDIPTDWLRMPATCHHKNEKLPELTEKFLSAEPSGKTHPMLFYLWGHSYEFARDGNWEIIEKFAEQVGGHDDIWYATNMEIYEYVESYRALIFSADMRMVQNPTANPVWFCFEDTLYRVIPGETVNLW